MFHFHKFEKHSDFYKVETEESGFDDEGSFFIQKIIKYKILVKCGKCGKIKEAPYSSTPFWSH